MRSRGRPPLSRLCSIRRPIAGRGGKIERLIVQDIERVKIFGERNTSTNALKRLIEMNSAARVLPSIAGDLEPGFKSPVNVFIRRIMGREYTETRIDRIFEAAPPGPDWRPGRHTDGALQFQAAVLSRAH